eukprot:scaffold30482_cov53-Attheya_sp.AAC.5
MAEWISFSDTRSFAICNGVVNGTPRTSLRYRYGGRVVLSFFLVLPFVARRSKKADLFRALFGSCPTL